MAYEGELVKMQNGRWARFQRSPINGATRSGPDDVSILVAVELEDRLQCLLDAAHASIGGLANLGLNLHIGRNPRGARTMLLASEPA